MWLWAGSAVAAMVGASWYVVVTNGGRPPAGDMVGHAATAEWLRTLPWWDWRGWSDWFYGGQAIGVNYPPLSHAWMRFTHPVHGQMAAVAIGLAVLLPWGSLRLGRAVGYTPRQQRAAVGAVLVLAAVSANMHWVLSGFHIVPTFFGSWPAMLATVIGTFAAAHAAQCRRPVAAGAVVAVAALFNASVVPGVAVVCLALVASSGASLEKALRWCATAAASAVAVCAWWLVPFVAGWERLVRWEVPLTDALFAGHWQAAVLAAVGAASVWAARSGAAASRRLALAALVGLGATLLADLAGYLRPERWLESPILVAALAAAGLAAGRRPPDAEHPPPTRPVWAALAGAFVIVYGLVTLRFEAVPLVVWLLWRPRRTAAWAGAISWSAAILMGSILSLMANPPSHDPLRVLPMEAAAAAAGPRSDGLVYADSLSSTAAGDVDRCRWESPWTTAVKTGGRLRPLSGLYRETSAAAEFLDAESLLREGRWSESGASRPNWFGAWQASGAPSLETRAAAAALGARWYATCDEDGNASVIDADGSLAVGVTVVGHASDEEWHRAATRWWIALASGARPGGSGEHPQVPVRRAVADGSPYPATQAATGVELDVRQDRLALTATAPGWAWIRVPWDPYWSAASDVPVHKGGPGHLVVWLERGSTVLRWEVPSAVDVAAAVVTGLALVATVLLSILNRRRGWDCEPGRPLPFAKARGVFADTVDEWIRAAARRARPSNRTPRSRAPDSSGYRNE